MIIDYCEQGTADWHLARLGLPTASMFSKILTGQGKVSKSRKDYMIQLLGERLAKTNEGYFSNSDMQRGHQLEESARNYYELITGLAVTQVGVCYYDESKRFACSPDGLILAKERGLEIKSPNNKTIAKYWLTPKLPPEYFVQVQGSMLVTGYDEWEFMAYNEQIKPLSLTIKKNVEFCEQLKEELIKFCNELDELEQTARKNIGNN